MAEPKDVPQKVQKYNKKHIIIGAVCLLLIAIGSFYIWHRYMQKHPSPVEVSSAVGTVDIDKLLPEHPDYPKLLQLQTEKMAIIAQLKLYATQSGSQQPIPQINPAPEVFTQVVTQQDNLQELNVNQILRERTVYNENKIRASMADKKNAEIKAINDKYFNEILNCTIKLDNAKNLKLTKEQQEELLSRMESLKRERGEAVAQLEQKYNIQVAKELMIWRAQAEAEINSQNAAKHQENVAASNISQQQEQQRTQEYMQDRLQMLQSRKEDSKRLLILLHTKDNEMMLLQQKMLKDISDKAAKVAIIKHLSMVVANVPMNENFFGNPDILGFNRNVFSGMVIGVDSVDITDDVLTELKNDIKTDNAQGDNSNQNEQDT